MEKKSLKIKIIIVAIAAVILAAIIGIIAFSNSPAQKLKKQLDLGQKYLNELSYDQAVAAFKQALEIETNNTDAIAGITKTYGAWSSDLVASSEYEAAIEKLDEARALLPDSQELVDKEVDFYIEWAEYCFNNGKYDDAFSVLEEGYEKINDGRLKNKIEELQIRKKEEEDSLKKKAKMEGIEKLYDFLLDYYNETILLGKHIYDWNGQAMSEYMNSHNVDEHYFANGGDLECIKSDNVEYNKFLDSGYTSIKNETVDMSWLGSTLSVYEDDAILLGTHIEDLFEKVGLEYKPNEWPLEADADTPYNSTKVHLGYGDSGEERAIFFDVRYHDPEDRPFITGLQDIQIPISHEVVIGLNIGLREESFGVIEEFWVDYVTSH